MKKIISLIMAVVFAFCLVSCNSEPSVDIISNENASETKFGFLENSGDDEEETAEIKPETKATFEEDDDGDYSGYVYVTGSGEKYHTSSCHHLRKSKIKISEKDAIAKGYTPCSVCKP